MARKSEIRLQAKAALDALLAATNEQDDVKANRLLQQGLEHLSEAAGITPLGTRLSEAADKAKLPAIRHVEDLRRAIDEAGSNPPPELRDHLRQHAHALGTPNLVPDSWDDDGGVRESTSLQEALAFATGRSAVNPRPSGGLLERVCGPRARDYLEG